MERILSKSLLIAVVLLLLFSAGCAKRAIPDTILEVEQTWFFFREGEITYDELKEQIAGHYIDLEKTVGEEVFASSRSQNDEVTILYKDLEGLSVDEIHDLVAAIYESFTQAGIESTVVSSQVSVSKPMDYFLDQQMAFSWREDMVEGLFPDDTCMILSTCYYLSKVDGEWKIDRSNSIQMGYQVSDSEEEKQQQIDFATLPYQDEAEYVQTITLK